SADSVGGGCAVTREVLLLIVIAIGVLLLTLMVLGWRSRQRRQRTIPAPHPVPQSSGAVIGRFDGAYVATVTAGTRYDRIAVHGLGFRGPVTITMSVQGIAGEITGAEPFWIPADRVLDARRTSSTIARAVERDGLQLVEWRLGDTPVESTFRLREP